MKSDPFKNLQLDPEEQEIEDAIHEEKMPKSLLTPGRKQALEQAAARTLKQLKSKPITLRVNPRDLEKVKQKAAQTAIPYQTLLSSLIHRYAEGKVKLDL